MKRKKLLLLFVSTCLILALAVSPFMAACAKPAEPGAAEIAALEKEVAALEKEIAKLEAAVPAPAEVYKWRLQTHMTPGGPDWDILLPRFKDRVMEMSDGQLDITLYPGGALMGAMEMFPAVAEGTLELINFCSAYTGGVAPVGLLMWSAPFGLDRLEQRQYLFYELGWTDILRKEYAKAGVYLLDTGPGYEYGPVMSTVPIRSVADFKGLKMRSYGIHADIYDALGAALTVMPSAEMYTALATGTLDAATWGGAEAFRMKAIHEVAKYYLALPIEMFTQIEFDVNPDAWNTLPDDLKAILRSATREYILEFNLSYAYLDAKALDEMVREHGVTVTRLPEAELAEMKEAATSFGMIKPQQTP